MPRIPRALLSGLAVVACLSACRQPIATVGGSSGPMPALVARSLAKPLPDPGPLRVLAIDDDEIWSLDPDTGAPGWRRQVRASGLPDAFGRTLVVPVRGQEIVALDLEDGALLWRTRVPGVAFTGLAIDADAVIVTALADTPRHRSLVAALSPEDGNLRWLRRSRGRFGVPEAHGGRTFVPLGDVVLALSSRTGRTLARLDPPVALALERVERQGKSLLAAGAAGFVDLFEGGQTLYTVHPGDTEAFTTVQGFDPGLRHADGLAFRLLAGRTPGAPRDAVFMGRRVLAALRLDPRGRPVEARWVHVQVERPEFVAMQVDDTGVLVMREDGSLLVFDAATGRRTGGFEGEDAIVAAVFVGGSSLARLPSTPAWRTELATAQLIGLLEDPDPRLLPAQRLAIDLLWRSSDPRTRDQIFDVAHGDDPRIAAPLRAHARAHVESEWWGLADRRSLMALLNAFDDPGRTYDVPVLEQAAREAVLAGGPAVFDRMHALLRDPGAPARVLEAMARALRDLDDSRGVETVADFVLRYHADPEIVEESLAIFYALELLLSQASSPRPPRHREDAARRALELLGTVVQNEFVVPKVRRFIVDRAMRGDPEDEEDTAAEPAVPSPSGAGRDAAPQVVPEAPG